MADTAQRGEGLEAGRELDALVANRVMRQVPCDAWDWINFGSAGGPALIARCNHQRGQCYPTKEGGSISGQFGGPARYSTDIRAAFDAANAVLDRLGDDYFWRIVSLRALRGRKWSASLCIER